MIKYIYNIFKEKAVSSSFKFSDLNPLKIKFASNNKPKNKSKRIL